MFPALFFAFVHQNCAPISQLLQHQITSKRIDIKTHETSKYIRISNQITIITCRSKSIVILAWSFWKIFITQMEKESNNNWNSSSKTNQMLCIISPSLKLQYSRCNIPACCLNGGTATKLQAKCTFLQICPY